MKQLPQLATSNVRRSVAGHGPGDHLVGFYEDETYLADAVASFLAPALRAGDAGVVVATPAHREQFAAALRTEGVDVEAAIEADALILLDASDLIDQFLRDAVTDRQAFRRVVGEVLARAGTGGREVNVFGEMVALLWERDNVTAVVELEDAWNDLAHEHPFVLFCAYPMHGFNQPEAAEAFGAVMERHTHVLPSQALHEPGGLDAHARLVALLEQELTSARQDRDALQARQRELEAMLDEMRERDALRNEFVSMVVHDIQSPTTVVSALLGLLRDNWPDMPDDVVDDHLDTALASIRRIERLTADILTVARIQSGNFTYDLHDVRLRDVVERAVTDVHGATGRRIDVAAGADLGRVRADADRQLQILTNLLTNAVKFSPETAAVQVTIEPGLDHQVVRVRDEGVGISPEEQAGLFLPFSRLHNRSDRVVRGTGLGLHTAKALVEGQGGRIWVESDAGKGATFCYTVPLADSPAEA
ncbi:ATP-binding protein [Egicoccus sp. AB-alg6-2]|uniref:ATP-binding protein n=1 Tax=Egicoccus sp. AB-alg6-2 TaxID=3242692 RepID=UPI00359DF319